MVIKARLTILRNTTNNNIDDSNNNNNTNTHIHIIIINIILLLLLLIIIIIVSSKDFGDALAATSVALERLLGSMSAAGPARKNKRNEYKLARLIIYKRASPSF